MEYAGGCSALPNGGDSEAPGRVPSSIPKAGSSRRSLLSSTKIIHGYEAQLETGCKLVAQCRYDGGAFGRIVDKRAYWNSGVDHLSIKGHAKAAAVAWAAMKRAGLVPRTG